MELSHLKYFELTANLQHITKAAEQLYISQPALSKTISKLEEELGVKLFDREGKNIYLNDYGKIVLRHTEKIFSELTEIQREISDMQNGTIGDLSVGTTWASSNPKWLVDSIAMLLEQYPDVNVKYTKMNDNDLIQAIMNRELDVAITSMPSHDNVIEWTPLFSERLGLTMSEKHPLAKQKSISMSQLVEAKFCIQDSSSDSAILTQHLCALANFRPNIYYTLDNPLLMESVLERGDSVSVIPINGYRESHNRQLLEHRENSMCFRPLSDDFCQRTCYMGILKNRFITKAQQAFIDTLCGATKELSHA